MVKIINEAVKVKNAKLIQDGNDFHLVHYDTEILTVINDKITAIYPMTLSSTRAIQQGLEYLGFSNDLNSIDQYCREVHGKGRKEVYKPFIKYSMDNSIHVTKKEYLRRFE